MEKFCKLQAEGMGGRSKLDRRALGAVDSLCFVPWTRAQAGLQEQ